MTGYIHTANIAFLYCVSKMAGQEFCIVDGKQILVLKTKLAGVFMLLALGAGFLVVCPTNRLNLKRNLTGWSLKPSVRWLVFAPSRKQKDGKPLGKTKVCQWA